MRLEEYKQIVKKHSKKENKFANFLVAFFVGGIIGLISQVFIYILEKVLYMPLTEAFMYVSIFWVILSSVLTGLGFFDKVVSLAKCGLIVPTTGFAHAMTSAAMDHESEGLVKGIGSNIFKLTGCVILYGIVTSLFLALLKGVIM